MGRHFQPSITRNLQYSVERLIWVYSAETILNEEWQWVDYTLRENPFGVLRVFLFMHVLNFLFAGKAEIKVEYKLLYNLLDTLFILIGVQLPRT